MALWQEKQAARPGSRRSVQAAPTSEPARTQGTASTTASTSDGIGKTGWRRHARSGAVTAAMVLLTGLALGITSALRRSPEAPITTAARSTPPPSPARAVQPAVVLPVTIRATPVQIATGAAVRRLLVVRTVSSRGESPTPTRAIRRSRPKPPPSARRAPSPPAAPAAPAPVAAVLPPPPPTPPTPPPVVVTQPVPVPVPVPVLEVDDPEGDDGQGDHEHGRPQHGGHDHGHHRGPDRHRP